MEASHDAVDAEALLVPIVGGGEEGAVAAVGVELGHRPGGRLVGERGGRSGLRGNRQPVGALVPAHGEEPLGVRRFQEPAQSRLEQPCRDGAVGQRQLLGYGRQPPHVGGSHQYSRRQVGAFGLDVEATRSDDIVEANSLRTGQAGGLVHQVAHRRHARARVSSPVFPRRPPWRGPRCIGEPGPQPGTQSFHLSPPMMLAGCRGAASNGPGCLR